MRSNEGIVSPLVGISEGNEESFVREVDILTYNVVCLRLIGENILNRVL